MRRWRRRVLELIDTMTMRALEVPEVQRSAFVDRAIAFLKSTGNSPMTDSWTGSRATSGRGWPR